MLNRKFCGFFIVLFALIALAITKEGGFALWIVAGLIALIK